MKIKYVPKISFGWYSENPTVGLVITLLTPIKFYNLETIFFNVINISFLKFEFDFSFYKQKILDKIK